MRRPAVMRLRPDADGRQERDGACPVCAADRGTVEGDRDGYGVHTLCARCGLGLDRRPPQPLDVRERTEVRAAFRRREHLIWTRCPEA
ncbi:hypothetical protein [Streptomyces sp. NPDC054961]